MVRHQGFGKQSSNLVDGVSGYATPAVDGVNWLIAKPTPH
jgi:hypothetical protein